MSEKSGPPLVFDATEAKANVGRQVAMKGIARDAKISAVVVAGNLVVYCLGLANWPVGMAGKPILVHGKLEQTAEFVARRGPGDEVGAGTDGPVWVLRDCRYESH